MVVDYYKILNIPRNASTELIHKAYRRKAKLYHPDVNQREDAKNNFLLISEAYQTLINPDKKKWYDFKLNYPGSDKLSRDYKHQDQKYSPFYNSDFNRSNKGQQGMENIRYTKTIVDKILFYSLVLVGALAIIFGAFRLDFERVNDSEDYGGIIFGVLFILLLFYGWSKLGK